MNGDEPAVKPPEQIVEELAVRRVGTWHVGHGARDFAVDAIGALTDAGYRIVEPPAPRPIEHCPDCSSVLIPLSMGSYCATPGCGYPHK